MQTFFISEVATCFEDISYTSAYRSLFYSIMFCSFSLQTDLLHPLVIQLVGVEWISGV